MVDTVTLAQFFFLQVLRLSPVSVIPPVFHPSIHSLILSLVRDRIPVGSRFSTPVQTGPAGHPVWWQWVLGLFPGCKVAGDWHWPPTPSSTEVKERAELYVRIYTPPLCLHGLLEWTLHYLIHSIHSFIHSFIHPFIYSFIHAFIRSFISRSFNRHSFIHSFTHSFIHSFIHSPVSFIQSVIQCPFIHSFIHSFTRSFIHLFFHSFIHSLVPSISIHSFIRSPVHSFTRSFFHLFVHSFIDSFVHSLVLSVSIHSFITDATWSQQLTASLNNTPKKPTSRIWRGL